MTSVDNPLTRTVRTPTDVGAPDAGIDMTELHGGATRPRRASTSAKEGSRKRMREHLRRAVRKDIDAKGTLRILHVLDKAEAALDGDFESDAAYEAQERRVRQLVARATDKLVVGSEAVMEREGNERIEHTHRVKQSRRKRRYGEFFDSGLGLLNEAGDVLFAKASLWRAHADLFWGAMGALCLTAITSPLSNMAMTNRTWPGPTLQASALRSERSYSRVAPTGLCLEQWQPTAALQIGTAAAVAALRSSRLLEASHSSRCGSALSLSPRSSVCSSGRTNTSRCARSHPKSAESSSTLTCWTPTRLPS